MPALPAAVLGVRQEPKDTNMNMNMKKLENLEYIEQFENRFPEWVEDKARVVAMGAET